MVKEKAKYNVVSCDNHDMNYVKMCDGAYSEHIDYDDTGWDA